MGNDRKEVSTKNPPYRAEFCDYLSAGAHRYMFGEIGIGAI